MRSIAGANLGRLQLLVTAAATVVALTGQPATARAGADAPRDPLSVATALTGHRPVRIAATVGPVRDASARIWRPDASYAVGGRLVATAHAIAHTASPVLYQRARLGVRGYRVPVSEPGTYFVDLFVAETRGAKPGHRVWNLRAEHRTVARSVDAARMSGQNRAGHVVFYVPVVDGTLDLHIRATQGMPLVGALEVDWRKASTVNQTLFSDTFDGPAGQSPSNLRWGYDEGGNGWGNHEQQTYTSRPRNASLDGDGHLFITARQERWTGADGVTRNYTSARLKTAGRFTFQYGTAAARIRVPSGAGLWPAFWALGSNFNTVGWPLCGELDVMENIGSQPRVTHASAHGGTTRGAAWQSGGRLRLNAPLGWKYRTYRLVWGPSAVAMSVDGQTYSSVSNADLPATAHWNLDHPFYLLLDLAVGGDWPGPPKSSKPFPAIMSVDSVKVRG